MNIFERASRKNLGFNTPRGILSVADLWSLPLVAKRNSELALDPIARDVNRRLKEIEEESFVEPKPNAQRTDLRLRLDILKHIIDSKMADAKEAEERAVKAEEKKILLQALSEKKTENIKSLSEEEIKKRIEAL